MDWKEFFRPNKFKTGVVVLILIIAIFTFIIATGILPTVLFPGFTLFNPESNTLRIIAVLAGIIGTILFEPIFILATLIPSGILLQSWIFDLFFLLIYWYSLSCLIVAIYNKIKKKRK